jgi:hypothetical protein
MTAVAPRNVADQPRPIANNPTATMPGWFVADSSAPTTLVRPPTRRPGVRPYRSSAAPISGLKAHIPATWRLITVETIAGLAW